MQCQILFIMYAITLFITAGQSVLRSDKKNQVFLVERPKTYSCAEADDFPSWEGKQQSPDDDEPSYR